VDRLDHRPVAPDPYFILPLLMTVHTMFQTWLNPTPPDPVQAKLMWFMPLIFSVMFFFFPAGLVLYWLTNNILSIAQQWFINKQLGVLGKYHRADPASRDDGRTPAEHVRTHGLRGCLPRQRRRR
jgi:membrane protein insertase Oxa1/YidC/SpoIIIJ